MHYRIQLDEVLQKKMITFRLFMFGISIRKLTFYNKDNATTTTTTTTGTIPTI